MQNKPTEVQIKINEETFKGTYANGTLISHTQQEFLLDFVSIFHQKGVLSARIIVNPKHAKRISKALQENIALYEKNFGPIGDIEEVNINLNS